MFDSEADSYFGCLFPNRWYYFERLSVFGSHVKLAEIKRLLGAEIGY